MMRLDGDFLRLCEGLHAAARRAWGRRFLGFDRGCGMTAGTTEWSGSEVSGYRDYVTGDDFRYIDWNRAARLDELVSKQFFGSETQRVDVLIDTSESMAVGGGSKFVLAQQLAAALGYLALAESKSVRLLALGAGAFWPWTTFHGRRQAPLWFGAVESVRPTWGSDWLAAAMHVMYHLQPSGRRVVIVLSDLLEPGGFQKEFYLLRRGGCELYVIQLAAPEEIDPPWLGAVRLQDVEGHSGLSCDLEYQDLANYRRVFAEFCQSVRRYCGRYGIGLSQFRSDAPLAACLKRLVEMAASTSDAGIRQIFQ